MRVCVAPLPNRLSRAMHRVARALRQTAPDDIEIVDDPRRADVQVLHVIDDTSFDYLVEGVRYVAIQYCYASTQSGADADAWRGRWNAAAFVWSYYDLPTNGASTYRSPLGVDDAFRKNFEQESRSRPLGVVTSGYVSGYPAEAIEVVHDAAREAGITSMHLGPLPRGMKRPDDWRAVHDISDDALAELYRSAQWVTGLRYVEGFELPAAEGACCGARPILFDRDDASWYRGIGEFVQENDETLKDELVELFLNPQPMNDVEIRQARNRFEWEGIMGTFWGTFDALSGTWQ